MLDSHLVSISRLVDTANNMLGIRDTLLISFNTWLLPQIGDKLLSFGACIDSVLALLAINKEVQKNGFKQNLKNVESCLKQMKSITKENKAAYIEIKKLSFEDQDEESLYIIENEDFAEQNNHIAMAYKSFIEYIDNRKSLAKKTYAMVKSQNKSIKKTLKTESRFFQLLIGATEDEYAAKLAHNKKFFDMLKALQNDIKLIERR
ncbi:MAG: hypothetical protein HC896_04585 [Bacteroidales bacterium]|nr:hypothetical protein [Bacteroidales bacterium]